MYVINWVVSIVLINIKYVDCFLKYYILQQVLILGDSILTL